VGLGIYPNEVATTQPLPKGSWKINHLALRVIILLSSCLFPWALTVSPRIDIYVFATVQCEQLSTWYGFHVFVVGLVRRRLCRISWACDTTLIQVVNYILQTLGAQ
jgi:hypothetical protein